MGGIDADLREGDDGMVSSTSGPVNLFMQIHDAKRRHLTLLRQVVRVLKRRAVCSHDPFDNSTFK
jgi:hypothetical protein